MVLFCICLFNDNKNSFISLKTQIFEVHLIPPQFGYTVQRKQNVHFDCTTKFNSVNNAYLWMELNAFQPKVDIWNVSASSVYYNGTLAALFSCYSSAFSCSYFTSHEAYFFRLLFPRFQRFRSICDIKL